MPYISPLKLLKDYRLPVELRLDRETLRIARQALLAEIDLSPNQSVMVGQKEMSRNDVLHLFDNLQGDQNWKYHEAIHRDQPLLDFLTEYKIPVAPIAKNSIYQEPKFTEFIAPFYPEVFANGFQQVLKKPSFERINALFNLPKAWQTRDIQKEINHLISAQMRQFTNKLERLIAPYEGKTGIVFPKKKSEIFYDHLIIDALNRLPESFDGIRTHYGKQLIFLAYILWNNKNRNDSQYIVHRIETLNGTSELQAHIDHYWRQCPEGEGYQATTSRENNSSNTWVYIAVIIFVLRFVGDCNKCASNSDREDRGGSGTYEIPTESSQQEWSRESKPKATSKPNEYDPNKIPIEHLIYYLDSMSTRANGGGSTDFQTEYDALYKKLKENTKIEKDMRTN